MHRKQLPYHDYYIMAITYCRAFELFVGVLMILAGVAGIVWKTAYYNPIAFAVYSTDETMNRTTISQPTLGTIKNETFTSLRFPDQPPLLNDTCKNVTLVEDLSYTCYVKTKCVHEIVNGAIPYQKVRVRSIEESPIAVFDSDCYSDYQIIDGREYWFVCYANTTRPVGTFEIYPEKGQYAYVRYETANATCAEVQDVFETYNVYAQHDIAFVINTFAEGNPAIRIIVRYCYDNDCLNRVLRNETNVNDELATLWSMDDVHFYTREEIDQDYMKWYFIVNEHPVMIRAVVISMSVFAIVSGILGIAGVSFPVQIAGIGVLIAYFTALGAAIGTCPIWCCCKCTDGMAAHGEHARSLGLRL